MRSVGKQRQAVKDKGTDQLGDQERRGQSKCNGKATGAGTSAMAMALVTGIAMIMTRAHQLATKEPLQGPPGADALRLPLLFIASLLSFGLFSWSFV
ncbi:hypothetical protein [uncultured Erythrobacter sp.]|uniref:hypothetical protein n=1 Tax=uncultured Erythrobacter sp. TaxID=263913 RepID=UPI003749ED32